MDEAEGLIPIHDPQWSNALLIKEIHLEEIINHLNATNISKLTPEYGYKYISNFAVGIIDLSELKQDLNNNILPFEDLIPASQAIKTDQRKQTFTCIKLCSIGFIDFSNQPDGVYKYVLLFQDEDSKFTILRPLASLESSEIYNCLADVVAVFGVPSVITTKDEVLLKNTFEKLNNFSENFESKVEPPQSSNELDNEIMHFKRSIEDWMDENKSTMWHDGLNIIQFENNCGYNSAIQRTPFDLLFKPNYEYVKRQFTRYLIHKPVLTQVTTERTDSSMQENENAVDTTMESEEKIYSGEDVLHMVIEPETQKDCENNNFESLVHILDETNKYEQLQNDKASLPENVDHKHIVIYRQGKKDFVNNKSCIIKLEPLNLKNSKDESNWVCRPTKAQYINYNLYKGNKFQNIRNNELNKELYNTEPVKDIESIEYIGRENFPLSTLQYNINNSSNSNTTKICLICKKKKKLSRRLNRSRIGKTVRLRTPIAERQKGCPSFILAVLVDILPNGECILGTPNGILKDVFSINQISECNQTFFTLDDVPKNKFINISEAIKDQKKISYLMKCTCTKQRGYCNPTFSYHDKCVIHDNSQIKKWIT